jgi:hypothetical protein
MIHILYRDTDRLHDDAVERVLVWDRTTGDLVGMLYSKTDMFPDLTIGT